MVNREEINNMIFIEQTTFYIYKSEKDLQDNKPTLVCSDKNLFEVNKSLAKKKALKGEDNKFIVL